MMRIVKAKPTTLKSPLAAGDTTVVLKELEDSKGNAIAMTSFQDEGVLVVKQGDVTEMIKFTGVTQNADGSATLTVASSGRNLDAVYPYAGAATGKDFNAGAVAIISDDPYTLWKITEDYTNGVALAGAPNASVTVKGVVETATLAQVRARTATGETGAALAVTPDVLDDLPTQAQKTFLNAIPGVILPYAGSAAPSGFLLCDGSAVSRTTYAALFAVCGTSYGTGDGSTTFNVPDLRSSVPLGKGQRVRTMTFDGASAVDPATDQITVTSNSWLYTGQAVALTGSTLPTGLSATTYYVIRVSATVIKLATSVANANAGTAVDITADGSGTCTLTQTLTSRALGDQGGEETHALADAEMPSHTHTPSGIGSDNSGSNAGFGLNSSGGNNDSPFGSETTLIGMLQTAGSDTAHNVMNPYTVVNYIISV